MYLKELKIGNVKLENNLILAPMAGVSDLPFRLISKKYGNPGLVCNEMVSSKAICYNDDKTLKMLETENEHPISMQIFGSDSESMGNSAEFVSKRCDILDINMGCPAPKVVKNGDGSKLLLDLELVKKIVEQVVKAVDVPVTVKMRKGWNNEKVVAVEAAKAIEEAGASAITIHGRTREEYYSGAVDLDIIKKVKEAVKIPVIGNGDVKSTKDALKMFEYTNVDGIMIGRATLGNPWIINQIKNELNGEIVQIPTNEEKLNTIKEHIGLEIAEKGEYIGIREMRKHISWYTKGLKNSSVIRNYINTITSKEELIKALTEYLS